MQFQSNAVAAYKQKQVEKAEEQLEVFKTTMSPEELNALHSKR